MMGLMASEGTDALHDELAARLAGSPRDAGGDAYRVESVLKRTAGETTQLVYLRTAAGGELGPFVRKVIDTRSGLGGAYVSLARREREGLRLRQLPRILECHQQGPVLVVVMEHISGRTLREVIEEAPPAQRPGLASSLVPAVCDAAAELHEALGTPIVHRDLTPGNVMCPDGDPATPVLIDLGIARTWHEGADTDTAHFGTRAYAPPEQYGFGQTDIRTDVYSLGLLAFFCLTGRDPSPSDRKRGFADPAVPEPWRAVIARAAALDPSERYQTARDLATAVRSVTVGRSPAVNLPVPLGLPREDRDVIRPSGCEPRLWTLRNVTVAAVFALYLLGCVSDAAMLEYWTGGSVAFNLFAFLVFMPYLGALGAYALLDKRWLRSHVRWLGSRTPPRAWRDLLLVLLGLFVLLVILAAAPGA